MKNTRHSNDIQVLKVDEVLLPELRNQWGVLFFVSFSDLRRIGSACAVSCTACVGSNALTLKVLLELDSALGIVEHLSEEVPFGFLDSLRFLVLVHWLLTFLVGSCLLCTLLCLSDIQSLICLLVSLLEWHALQPSLDILAQVLIFDSLPLVSKFLNRFESTTNLFLSKLTVLAHRVDADDVLNLGRSEGLWLDNRPVSLIFHILSVWVIRK